MMMDLDMKHTRHQCKCKLWLFQYLNKYNNGWIFIYPLFFIYFYIKKRSYVIVILIHIWSSFFTTKSMNFCILQANKGALDLLSLLIYSLEALHHSFIICKGLVFWDHDTDHRHAHVVQVSQKPLRICPWSNFKRKSVDIARAAVKKDRCDKNDDVTWNLPLTC